MNSKSIAGVLAVVCVVLGVFLLVTRRQASQTHAKATETILSTSNRWQETRIKLDEQKAVNGNLEADLARRKEENLELTNQLASTATALTQAQASAQQTAEQLEATRRAVAQREEEINKLKQQNTALDRTTVDLNTSLARLNKQIDDTKTQLAAAEGDKVLLQEELQRLLVEKAQLERKFQDLKVLKDQVAKLKEELSVSRRMEWIRKGFYNDTSVRGAQLLLRPGSPGARPAAKPPANPDLKVEMDTQGNMRIGPAVTNAPAATNKPGAK